MRSLKKICFVTDEYDHPSFHATGGIGTFIKNLAYELKDQGIEVHVFSYMYITNRPNMINDNGVIIHSVKRANKIINLFFKILGKIKIKAQNRIRIEAIVYKFYFSFQLYRFSWKNKFDLFEFNDFSGDSCFFLKKNVIIRCHGNAKTLHEHMAYPKYDIPIFFERLAFNRHSHIVCVSEYCKNVTMKSFNLKKHPRVVYNGVKVKTLLNDEKKYEIVDKSIYYFGSLRERKGLIVACNVINKAILKYPDITFHLIGKNENKNWENICLAMLSPSAIQRTFYHGSLEQSKAFEFLKNAHIVLFPSFGENFSIALLEVMALGKIVITSTIPSFKEVIIDGENGFLANDESEYIDRIDFIFKMTSIVSIATNAYETVEKKFDNRNIVMDNINYYQDVLKSNKIWR